MILIWSLPIWSRGFIWEIFRGSRSLGLENIIKPFLGQQTKKKRLYHLWTNVLILVLMVLIEFFSFISIVTKKVKFKIQSLNKYIKSCKLKIRHFRSKIIKMITRVNSRICTNYPLHSRFSRIRQWSFSWKFLKIVCIWMRKNPRI